VADNTRLKEVSTERLKEFLKGTEEKKFFFYHIILLSSGEAHKLSEILLNLADKADNAC
jgi:hypothetical protein